MLKINNPEDLNTEENYNIGISNNPFTNSQTHPFLYTSALQGQPDALLMLNKLKKIGA